MEQKQMIHTDLQLVCNSLQLIRGEMDDYGYFYGVFVDEPTNTIYTVSNYMSVGTTIKPHKIPFNVDTINRMSKQDFINDHAVVHIGVGKSCTMAMGRWMCTYDQYLSTKIDEEE